MIARAPFFSLIRESQYLSFVIYVRVGATFFRLPFTILSPPLRQSLNSSMLNIDRENRIKVLNPIPLSSVSRGGGKIKQQILGWPTLSTADNCGPNLKLPQLPQLNVFYASYPPFLRRWKSSDDTGIDSLIWGIFTSYNQLRYILNASNHSGIGLSFANAPFRRSSFVLYVRVTLPVKVSIDVVEITSAASSEKITKVADIMADLLETALSLCTLHEIWIGAFHQLAAA